MVPCLTPWLCPWQLQAAETPGTPGLRRTRTIDDGEEPEAALNSAGAAEEEADQGPPPPPPTPPPAFEGGLSRFLSTRQFRERLGEGYAVCGCSPEQAVATLLAAQTTEAREAACWALANATASVSESEVRWEPVSCPPLPRTTAGMPAVFINC